MIILFYTITLSSLKCIVFQCTMYIVIVQCTLSLYSVHCHYTLYIGYQMMTQSVYAPYIFPYMANCMVNWPQSRLICVITYKETNI